MPRAARRPCAHPGCSQLVERGRCEKHRRQQQRHANTKTPEERKFYSSAKWQKIRREQLRREPLCRECSKEGRVKVATVADHITPRRLGGGDDQLQSLCWTHHQVKRQREREDGPAAATPPN